MTRRDAAAGVPNFSEGRNQRVIGALEATLGCHARILNRHFDAQHNRSVFTMAADRAKLVEALVAGAAHAIELIDLRCHQGLHPHIGALDVCPVVWQIDERHDDAPRRRARSCGGNRGARGPGLLLRRAGEHPGAAGARLLPPGRAGRAGAPDGVG